MFYLEKLVQVLAFQVGSQVSYHELGQMAGGLDNETAEQYIQLLEKVFVVFRLGSFCRNLRNELKKPVKYISTTTGCAMPLSTNSIPWVCETIRAHYGKIS